MARTIKDAKLDTRKARERLPVDKRPVWRSLEQGRSIGYRKSREGAAWLARMYQGDRKYLECRLGGADDVLDADGVDILDFAQAQAKAREWFAATIAAANVPAAPLLPYTVSDACRDYLLWFRENRKSAPQTEATINSHILPELGEKQLPSLTTADLRRWLNDTANTPRRVRKKKSEEGIKLAPKPETPEDTRRRRSTANRILNVLKAVLNRAIAEWDQTRGDVPNSKAWDAVKGFREADAARVRFLETDEARRLVNACPEDFRRLVRGALHTGARYGELTKMKVADYRDGRVLVAISKGAKSRWISLDQGGRDFFDSITMGRAGDETLFLRGDGGTWGKTHQVRRIEDACKAASISPPCSFHELRHTYASLALMAGMPLMVLAQNLGHRDTRMVEKHYGHLLQSYKDKMVEEFAPKFGFEKESNATKM